MSVWEIKFWKASVTFEREGAGDEGGRKEGRKERMDTAEGNTRQVSRAAWAAAALLFDFVLHVAEH